MNSPTHLTNDVATMLSLPPGSPVAAELVSNYYSEVRQETGGGGNTHRLVRERVTADHASGRLVQRYVTMLHDPSKKKLMTEAWQKMVADTWPTSSTPQPSPQPSPKKTTAEELIVAPKVIDLSLKGSRPGGLVREPAVDVRRVCEAAREASVMALTKQLEETTAALTKMADRVEQRERYLKRLEAELSQLETGKLQFEYDQERLVVQNQKLRHELKRSVSSSRDLRREVDGLMEKNERYVARIDDLERELRERDAEDSDLYEPPSSHRSHRHREEKKRRRR